MRRRTFLIGAAAAAGGLAVGYRVWDERFEGRAAELVQGKDEALLAGWIKIAGDGTVTVYVPHVDMGQGVHTALAMIAAEELDADWSKVRAEQAPPDKAFANRFLAKGWVMQGFSVPGLLDGAVDTVFTEAARFINLQQTGGSTAVRLTGQVGLRIVGAAARAMLIEAAARRWRVPAAELVTEASMVRHEANARTLAYGAIAAEAAMLAVPQHPRLKEKGAYRLVGTSPPRADIPPKVTGGFTYAIDVTLPDMVYATVTAAPVHGGRLISVDPAPALAVAGVEQVVPLDKAVAVIGRGYWQASRGLAALTPVFSDAGHGTVSSASFEAAMTANLDGKAEQKHAVGDVDAVLRAAPGRIVEATYQVPFLHHAPMEPISVTAQWRDGKLKLWMGDQNPLGAKAEIVRLSGLKTDDVEFVPMAMGGSFGRRGNPRGNEPLAYLAQAIELARRTAPRPLKLIWSREEDFAQGAYRPAAASRLRAALDGSGMPLAWSQVYVEGVDSPSVAFGIPYTIANQSMRAVKNTTHVQRGFWRSVNHTQHGFWAESFIDELARAAGIDPFEYRRRLLPAGSRERRVLETAAEKAGWTQPPPNGVGRGVALVESYGSIVAEVVEASVEDGQPRVHRVVAAVDCGDLCHPDTARQQVEGAIVMGLSAALDEEITLEGGAVVQRNFPDYPILTLEQTPEIEVHFLKSDGAWGGLGEPGLPPVAPALANALFAATGRRIRQLPITRALARRA